MRLSRLIAVWPVLIASGLGILTPSPAAAAAHPHAAAAANGAGASSGGSFDIPYTRFVLDNGLTLIVHEDHKAPIVAVNVWYHVGSKNEKPGKTGFAHLFEHLMFNGSENNNDDYFKVLDRIGATDLNGTTNEDRTCYFQNVPKSAIDTVLWMESDRMGHLVGAIDQARLEEQRGVVQNEKRQDENEPYAVAYELATKSTWPDGHPYSWTVIGSMADLNAASLDDVKEWFKTYYGPANATIVVAGDIDTQTALDKVKHYFGDIPSGPPVSHQKVWIAKRTGSQRQIAQDRVPQAKAYLVWNAPEWGTPEVTYLALAAEVLGTGKTSRLYKRLVYDERIATDVNAAMDVKEIASQFNIEVTAIPGGDLARIEKEIGEELQRFLAQGPTPEELARVKTEWRAGFIRGSERIGGFGGKSDILARGQVFGGDPASYKKALDLVAHATAADIQSTAKAWLSDGDYTLEVVPFPDYKEADKGADRSGPPEAGAPQSAVFPKMERTTLANGLEIVLAERHAVPIVNFDLILDAGYASDQLSAAGTASLAMAMLDEGTAKRTALQIDEELALLGAELEAGSNLDLSTVSFSALKDKLEPSLDIFADVVLNPTFPQSDFERLKALQLSGIEQEKTSPFSTGLRIFPRLLFGKGHAYGNPLTGSGYESTVSGLTRADLAKFHDDWFKPNNARLVVVGDTTMAEIRPKIEALFGGWKQGTVPKKNLKPVDPPAKSVLYISDRPGALQSIVLAGTTAPPRSPSDEAAIETMNNILGGDFTARINMDLREDKHWSYGAGSFIPGAQGPRAFIAYAPVQTDKTMESVKELDKDLREFVGDKPAAADELARAQAIETRSLAGSWETSRAVVDSITEILRYGLPDDYFTTYPAKVMALTLPDISSAAKKVVKPSNTIWVVIGDRAKIEPRLKELGWGEIHILDGDGNPVN